MPGKNSRLTSLAARKKLLVVESDLNRLLLRAELAEIKKEFREVTARAVSQGLLAMAVAQAGAAAKGLFHSLFHRAKPDEPRKASWLSVLLRGVRAGVLVWSALRSGKR